MKISFKQLGTTPTISFRKSHYFCDYVELVALCNSSDPVSVVDIYDRFYDDERINGIGTDYGAESNDKWMKRIQCWFDEILVRFNSYGTAYPFVLENGSIRIKEVLGDKCYMYLSLLLSSSLSYINNTSILTSAFEEITVEAMKTYLFNRAKVYHFGKSSFTGSRYSGSLKNKIEKLAVDIKRSIICDDKVFQKHDTGDGGADVVAWLPFENDHNIERIQLFLVQSATGKNWDTKQDSVTRLKNFINIPENAQNVLFVPYDFRDTDRDFNETTAITAALIFDRQRILNLIDAGGIWQSTLGQSLREAVDVAIAYEEDIV